MRQRRLASSSSDMLGAPSGRRSNVSNNSSSSPSAFNPASSLSTFNSTSTNKSCEDFLIPDTDDYCTPSQIARLAPQSRRSTWDRYLFETAMQRQSYERDRLMLRKEILSDMKQYYGHERWKKAECIEDVELWDSDKSLKNYLDRLVLYGEHSKRKSRYVDRAHRECPKSAFKRRPYSYDGAKAGFFVRLRDRLVDDFKALGV